MGRLRARHKSIRELRIKEKDARRARRGKSPLRHLPILHLLLLLAALFTPLDCARLLSNKSVQTIVVKQLRSSLYTPFYRRAPRTGLQREMSECDRETDSRRSLASPEVSRASSPFILRPHLLSPGTPAASNFFNRIRERRIDRTYPSRVSKSSPNLSS